jgi:hypothetical protein
MSGDFPVIDIAAARVSAAARLECRLDDLLLALCPPGKVAIARSRWRTAGGSSGWTSG